MSSDTLLVVRDQGLYGETQEGRESKESTQRSRIWLRRSRSQACRKGREYEFNMNRLEWLQVGSGEASEARRLGSCTPD